MIGMAMPSSPSVFISYADDTKRLAQILSSELERNGVSSWVDFKDLKPGQRWQAELERAVAEATSFLILVSPHSSATPQLEAEWRAAVKGAWESEKALIPVVFGGSHAPPFLQNWVAVHIKPGTEPSKWTERILAALRAPDRTKPAVTSKATRVQRRQRLDELDKAARLLKELPGERGR